MSRPRSIQIQHMPNILLLDTDFGIGDLDDGLIYIGLNFCYNHDEPKCISCPVANLCEANIRNKSLIKDFRT